MTIDDLTLHSNVAFVPCWTSLQVYKLNMPPTSRKNYKGRSPNVLRYIQSCGNEDDIGSLLASNLAAGARLAAENETQAHDEKTSRTYELRLMALEKFAECNGDDAVLFGPNKRPFLAATIQTYMRKFVFNLSLCYLLHLVRLCMREKFSQAKPYSLTLYGLISV